MTATAARIAYSPKTWGGGGGGNVEGADCLSPSATMARVGDGEGVRSVMAGLQLQLPLAHHHHRHRA